jgi:tRNA(Met) C34 N-acetyltransferase TmcA
VNPLENNKRAFSQEIEHQFGFEPVGDQVSAIKKMVDFTFDQTKNGVFILSGYAGTGKTTLLGAFVKALGNFKKKTILLAPTGRAAKVLSNRSKKQALTIHKRIYRNKIITQTTLRFFGSWFPTLFFGIIEEIKDIICIHSVLYKYKRSSCKT